MLLDKSSEQDSSFDVSNLTTEFFTKKSNLILSKEAFDKAEFLNFLFRNTTDQIILLDMDLLMTGYFQSDMIPKMDNLMIFSPDKDTWKIQLAEIIAKFSDKRCLIVVDSLNGAYNLFEGLESIRFVDSCMMLLLSLIKKTNSIVVTTVSARKNKEKGWIMSPGGKEIINSDNTNHYILNKKRNKLVIAPLVQETRQVQVKK